MYYVFMLVQAKSFHAGVLFALRRADETRRCAARRAARTRNALLRSHAAHYEARGAPGEIGDSDRAVAQTHVTYAEGAVCRAASNTTTTPDCALAAASNIQHCRAADARGSRDSTLSQTSKPTRYQVPETVSISLTCSFSLFHRYKSYPQLAQLCKETLRSKTSIEQNSSLAST